MEAGETIIFPELMERGTHVGELGPDVCPHFRGCYVQASMELGPEDMSLLERYPHFRGCYVHAGFNGVGT